MPLVVFLAGTVIYAFWEPYWLQINHYTINADLAHPIKIAHISDLHTNTVGIRERRLIKILDQEKPDLIALTGDLISDGHNYRAVAEVLRMLHAPLGVYWVRGNWENWFPASVPFRQLTSSNAQFLDNQSHRVTDGLWIVGLDDLSSGVPDLKSAFEKVPQTSFVLVLSHSPALFDDISGKCQLVLSGHTHGGQVKIPFLGALWLPEGSGPYVSGWYMQKECRMYVSRGIGTSILPIRFLSRPEIAFINLVAHKKIP